MRTAASKKTERASSESSGIQPDSVKLTVRLIDGVAFRGESLDKQEFGNWATSYEYDEIPANAVWVDERVSKTDLHFFLLNAEAYLGALKAGYSVDESAEYGLAIEQSERERSSEGGGDHPYHDEIIQDIYIQLQQTLPGDEEPVEVWLVDGTLVRGISKTDFVEGGHAYVYPWIPEKEIWIEQDVAEEEREFVILHEHTERHLMRNELLGYDEAHERASKVEFAARQKAQQGDKYYDIERAGNTEPVQLPPAEMIRTARTCPVCGAQAKSIPGGWRCGTPPCEWSLLQAGGDNHKEKAVATVDGLGIDPQGGVEPTDLAKAEAADLITLPRGVSGTNCANCLFFVPMRDVGKCRHPKVDQMVNNRNCCRFWDATGTYRAWKSDHQTKDGNVFGIEPIRPQPEHHVPEPHGDETGTIDKALSAYNELAGGALVPPPAQGTAMTLRRKYGRTRSLLGKKSLDPPRVSSSSVGRAPLTVQGGSSGVRPAPAPHHAQPSPTPSAHSTPSSAGKAPSPKTSGSSPSQRAPVRETTTKPAAGTKPTPVAGKKPTTVKPERPPQTSHQPEEAQPAKPPAEKRTNEDNQPWGITPPFEAMGLPETDEDEPYLDLDEEDEGTIPRGEPVAEPHRPEAPSIPPSRLAEQRAAEGEQAEAPLEDDANLPVPGDPEAEGLESQPEAPDEVPQRTGPAYGVNPETYAYPDTFATDALIAATIAKPGMTSAEKQNIYQTARDYFVAQQESGLRGASAQNAEASRAPAPQSDRRPFVEDTMEERQDPNRESTEAERGSGEYQLAEQKSHPARVREFHDAVQRYWPGHTIDDVVRLLGLPPTGARFFVNSIEDGKVSLSAHGDGFNLKNTFNLANQTVYADGFFVEKTHQKKGIATAILSAKMKALIEAGFKKTSCLAGRSPDMNGYYTWPLMGYDADLPRSRLPKLPDSLAGAQRISDLMETQEGVDWWKEHGIMMNMEFDLSEGSRSRRALALYLEKRKQQGR